MGSFANNVIIAIRHKDSSCQDQNQLNWVSVRRDDEVAICDINTQIMGENNVIGTQSFRPLRPTESPWSMYCIGKNAL